MKSTEISLRQNSLHKEGAGKTGVGTKGRDSVVELRDVSLEVMAVSGYNGRAQMAWFGEICVDAEENRSLDIFFQATRPKQVTGERSQQMQHD